MLEKRMKMKRFLCILAGLMIISGVLSISYAEKGLLAFESKKYDVIPQKSITLKPIAQGIEEKLIYKWESSDSKIAKVNKNGKVTGINVGEAEITCIGTTKSGEEYKAVCTVKVNRPIKKISAYEKTVTLPNFYKFSILDLFSIEPLGLEWYPLQVEVKNTDVIKQYGASGENYYTAEVGKAKIILKANDGSGKKASVNIVVPNFIYSDKSIVVDEKERKLFWYSCSGTIYMGWDYSSDLFTMKKVEGDEAKKYDGYLENLLSSSIDYYLIIPKKAGKGYINFSVNGHKYKINVEITENASPYQSKTSKGIGTYDVNKKMTLTGTVIKKGGKVIRNDIEYYIVYLKQGDDYFAILSTEEPLCSEMNDFIVYGTLIDIREFKTETGLVFRCPEIEVDNLERDMK